MLKKNTVLSYIGLFVVTIIWGYAFVVVKSSLDAVPPVYMLAFRFTIASVGLLIIFRKKLKLIDKGYILSGALIGAVLFLAYLVQTIGIRYTTAGKNAFLTTTYVIIVPFLYWAAYKKNPGKYAVIAAFMAITGIGLLSLKNNFTINLGDTLSLLSGLGYAVHIFFVGKITQKRDPVLLTVLQLSAAAVFSWITAPLIDGSFPVTVFEKSAIISMLYLGLFSTMAALLLQNVCQKYTSPSTAALIMSLESVFGVLFSVLILSEELSFKMICGCSLIFAAIILSETRLSFFRSKTKRKTSAPK